VLACQEEANKKRFNMHMASRATELLALKVALLSQKEQESLEAMSISDLNWKGRTTSFDAMVVPAVNALDSLIPKKS